MLQKRIDLIEVARLVVGGALDVAEDGPVAMAVRRADEGPRTDPPIHVKAAKGLHDL